MFFKDTLEDRLAISVTSVSRVAGGDINDVYRVDTSKGPYIIKVNESQSFPKMFYKEAKGLDLLSSGGVFTPKVIDQFEQDKHQLLLLEYIEENGTDREFWKNFGQDLFKLHRNSQDQFGLNHHNFIGSLHQDNDFEDSWEEFFIVKRLKPLVRTAYNKGLLGAKHLEMFTGFYKCFSELVPVEPPSLLHGDLWSGNLLFGLGQKPVFIDPAVYYGHREIDIAMTFMFGGFDHKFLEDYQNGFPLEKGWEQRIAIHNLYPNLVHLNLFGISYLGNIEKVVQNFT